MSINTSIKILPWDEALASFSAQRTQSNKETLLVTSVPRPELPITHQNLKLNPIQYRTLAETLIALVGVPDYTPTSQDSPIPLRLDLMLRRLLEQPTAFLPPLLRNWCEWFGLQPNATVNQVWTELISASSTQVSELSEAVAGLVNRSLAYLDDDYLYMPLPVAIAIGESTHLLKPKALPDYLHKLRHALLRNKRTQSANQAYQQITAFLRNPSPSLEGHSYRTVRARGELVNLERYEWPSNSVPQPVVDATLITLQSLYETDSTNYQKLYNRVHGPVWDAVGHAMDAFQKIEEQIPSRPVVIDQSNYADSCRVVSNQLMHVSEAYAILTELETTLGVDRYLGGKALSNDLKLVHSKVQRIAEQIHRLLNKPHQLFLRKWNLTSPASLVLHLLNISSEESKSTLTEYFPYNQQRVIFLLVDALGYTQFHWFLKIVGRRRVAPLSGNIFAWLQKQHIFNEKYMLASNLVSVTGACLPTIFTGALPRDTGIIGSHMVMEGHHLNVLSGRDMKSKLETSEVEDIYRRNVNRSLIPFAQIAYETGVNTQVFHGGGIGFSPLAEFTYGRLLNEKLVKRVSQADRVFAVALPAILDWKRNLEKKHLALFYYPLIDKSGHGCGPYTQFQTAELNKLNFTFTHFLVDLATQAEEIFDGQTSIVITADHGMFESATTAIKHSSVRNILGGKAACKDMTFVYDNRAMHIYGVDGLKLESMRTELVEHFATKEIPISVHTRQDPLVADLLRDPSSPWAGNCPDIILQFHGPGVFFYNENLPSHMFLYGAHGGISVEETFVPLVHFTLTPELANGLKKFL
jgi:hypothetical protein